MKIKLKKDLIICDLEATCWRHDYDRTLGTRVSPPSEIIELACIRVDKDTFEIKAEFTEFVKPVASPILSSFCTQLTSITQKDVNDAASLGEVFQHFEQELKPYECYAWSSWGKYDKTQIIREFISKDLEKLLVRFIELPHINLKKLWQKEIVWKGYVGHKRCGLAKARRYMGIEHVGTPHRGICDCYTTRLVVKPLFAQTERRMAMDYSMIKFSTMDTIKRYVEIGCPTGSFLEAVLCDKLMAAFGKADLGNRATLYNICDYIYNEVPAMAWGSEEKYNKWVELGGMKGIERKEKEEEN